MRKGPQCRAEETPKTLHSKSCKGQRSFSDRSSALLQWAVLTLLPCTMPQGGQSLAPGEPATFVSSPSAPRGWGAKMINKS